VQRKSAAKIKDARLKRKSRRPLQIQPQRRKRAQQAAPLPEKSTQPAGRRRY